MEFHAPRFCKYKTNLYKCPKIVIIIVKIDSSCSSEAEAQMYRELIVPPIDGTLSYKVCMDKQNFKIANGFFSPVPGIYTFDLPNSISLIQGTNSGFVIKIRIPRQMLTCKYGYEIPMDGTNTIQFKNPAAGLKITSSSGIVTFNANTPFVGFQINNSLPSIVEFFLGFAIEDLPSLIDICSISYNVSFDSVKLKSIYTSCKEHKNKHKCRHADEKFKLKTETIFETFTSFAN